MTELNLELIQTAVRAITELGVSRPTSEEWIAGTHRILVAVVEAHALDDDEEDDEAGLGFGAGLQGALAILDGQEEPEEDPVEEVAEEAEADKVPAEAVKVPWEVNPDRKEKLKAMNAKIKAGIPINDVPAPHRDVDKLRDKQMESFWESVKAGEL